MTILEAFGFASLSHHKYNIYDAEYDTEILTYTIGNVTQVSFNGSDSWTDFISNLFCLPKKIDTGIYVHSGFWDAFQNVREKLYSMAARSNRLFITGFSRGSGIAMLFAYDAMRNGYSVDLRTFATPRIGNNGFFDEFVKLEKNTGSTALAIKNGNDAICKLPPWFCEPPDVLNIGEPTKWWKYSFWQHDWKYYNENINKIFNT